MGKSALEGLEGIETVTRGFRGLREINAVTYDPEIIAPDRMVEALKSAGTYSGTAEK